MKNKMNKHETKPDLVPQSMARDHYNLGRSTINTWIKRGKLEAVDVRGQRWVRISCVEKLIKKSNAGIEPARFQTLEEDGALSG